MTALVQVGAVSGAILAVAAVTALAWKAFLVAVESAIGSRIDRVVQQQYEQDADFNSAIGELVKRLQSIETAVKDVRAQVYPNSGSSLRDRVDELHAMVAGS
jgi:hypothetical protein